MWIQPGDAATLIWHGGRADGGRLYRVAGPALEAPPASPYFLLAPVEESHFAPRLYAAEATLPVLRSFLGGCTLAEGRLDPSLAEDASVFMWTMRAAETVRVSFLIQNEAGVWTCRLHPFEFRKEAS